MWQHAGWVISVKKMIKKKKPSATLQVGRTMGCVVAIISIPMLLAMLIPPVSAITFLYAFLTLVALLVVGFAADLFSPARITLTDDTVQLRIRRTGEVVTIPWTDFTCLYELDGCKQKIYLLTPSQMDKEAQLAAYKACCKNKAVPYTHEGCLMLNAYVHGDVIDQYLPPHLKKMPWRHCAKL